MTTPPDLAAEWPITSEEEQYLLAVTRSRELAALCLRAAACTGLPWSSDLLAGVQTLLVTREQQRASEDRLTTLRDDARYLRGLTYSPDIPMDESDMERLRTIARKLEHAADLLVPEHEETEQAPTPDPDPTQKASTASIDDLLAEIGVE